MNITKCMLAAAVVAATCAHAEETCKEPTESCESAVVFNGGGVITISKNGEQKEPCVFTIDKDGRKTVISGDAADLELFDNAKKSFDNAKKAFDHAKNDADDQFKQMDDRIKELMDRDFGGAFGPGFNRPGRGRYRPFRPDFDFGATPGKFETKSFECPHCGTKVVSISGSKSVKFVNGQEVKEDGPEARQDGENAPRRRGKNFKKAPPKPECGCERPQPGCKCGQPECKCRDGKKRKGLENGRRGRPHGDRKPGDRKPGKRKNGKGKPAPAPVPAPEEA